MKAVKQTVRKYYKYIQTAWTQPILSKNGTLGVDDFAVQANTEYNTSHQTWHAFDGSTSSYWRGNANSTPNLIVYSQTAIRCTQINIRTGTISGYNVHSFTLSGSNNGTDYTIITNVNIGSPSGTYVFPIENTENYNYYKFDLTPLNQRIDIEELTLIGTQIGIIESTIDDYDFYKDVEVYKVPKETITKYWKYQYSEWIQPTLTTPAGNPELQAYGPASQGSDLHTLFDKNPNTLWHSASGSEPWNIDIVSNKLLSITKLEITNRSDDPRFVYAPYLLNIYSSNDGVNYSLINSVNNTVTGAGAKWTANVTNSEYFNYYRFQFYNSQSYIAFMEIEITATQKLPVEVTKDDDYDYTTEHTIYKAIRS